MQPTAIEKKIRTDIIAQQFPDMSDAQVTHQTYPPTALTPHRQPTRTRGGTVQRRSAAGTLRHQFVYQKQFGTGEAPLYKTIIVTTDDDGTVLRVSRSR
jgi:hypothetical protein